ncbi:MAG: AraC family transcriptional regulator [Lachnospiraceae bacterium]|nr:AraC family transcriptional regulator [Lachnospiraceae bacterium]
MQELNYLKWDKKTQGQESFVTYVDFQVQNGTADMWLYDIFPGVQLMVVDFASESCFRNIERQNVIGINHCRKGRFECAFDSRNYLYLGEGDIALNSQMHPPIASSFPLKYFYGSTIILFPEIMKTVPELQAFQISAEKIAKKYSLETKSPVFRRNAEIEHVYQELYTHLGHPSLPFLRLKVLELLYHFQSRQTVFEENQEYISGVTVDRIKHVREHLIQDMEHRINLKELALEHNLSLTQLKDGFRQIYGESPYAYLRSYKMHRAAQLLRQSNRKISEIALELGYQNPSKFSEAFYAVTGCKPSAYRKEKKMDGAVKEQLGYENEMNQ